MAADQLPGLNAQVSPLWQAAGEGEGETRGRAMEAALQQREGYGRESMKAEGGSTAAALQQNAQRILKLRFSTLNS